MSERSRMPGLALPFLLVGGAAGWLSAGVLANPLLGITGGGEQALAAAIAAAVAGVVGWAIGRWCRDRGPWHEPQETWTRLVVAVVAGGGVTGALVAGLGYPSIPTIAVGTINGALCSVAFLPVCALVLRAAKRAERARLGSLVAASDHRAVWGVLATALAATTAAGALDWLFVGKRAFATVEAPRVAVAILVAAGLVIAGVLVADVRALRRIRTAGLEERETESALATDAARRLDLGLGAGVLAEVARGATAYRSRERAVALVIGDVDEARAALRRALLCGALGLTVVTLTGSLHALARAGAAEVPDDVSEVWCLGRVIARATASR